MKSLSEVAASWADPVDPELFLWCQGIYYAAASLTMPVESPAAKPAFTFEGQTYAFADRPLNRGMLAVMKELRERGVSDEVKMAMTSRLMHFGEVFEKHKILEPFIKPGPASDEVQISEALIKACATAKMLNVNDHLRFDIDDVARIAQRLSEEEESAK